MPYSEPGHSLHVGGINMRMVVASGGWKWNADTHCLQTLNEEISFFYKTDRVHLEKILLYLDKETLVSLYEPALHTSPIRPPKNSQLRGRVMEQVIFRPNTTIKVEKQEAEKLEFLVSHDSSENDGSILVLWGTPGTEFEVLSGNRSSTLTYSTHQCFNGVPRIEFGIILKENAFLCLKVKKPDGRDEYYLLMNTNRLSVIEFPNQNRLQLHIETTKLRGENAGSPWPKKRGNIYDPSLTGRILSQMTTNRALS